MQHSSRKRKTKIALPKDAPALPPIDPLRTGMPAQDSITSIRVVEKGGKAFRIIKTAETDAYDEREFPKRGGKRRRG